MSIVNRNKKTDREKLLSIFTFFQVSVTEHVNTFINHKHNSINAADRRYIFDNHGRVVRIVEKGNILFIDSGRL